MAPAEDAPQVEAARPEGWPADLPWVSPAPLQDPQLETSRAGDLRVRWTTSSNDLNATTARLLEALSKAGYTKPKPCHTGDGDSCLLRRPDRLAVLSAGSTYSGSGYAVVELHLYPPGHQPLARLPGKCVAPPTLSRTILVSSSGIDQEGELQEGQSQWSVATHPGPDLDGDGVPETYVPKLGKERCPWEVPHDVYVMRGSCGHRVGTIVGLPDAQTSMAPFANGLRTVTTNAEWAAYDGKFREPNHHSRTRHYQFDGHKLGKVADDDRVGICHHCGVASCNPIP